MTEIASRHLGIDLGVTNLKWAVVEHSDGDWRDLDHGQRPTFAAEGPDAVVGRLAEIGRAAVGRWPAIASIGIGVPGLYDPASGSTRFLVNMPGEWAGRPVAPPVQAALGLPTSLINDARAFGLAELRLGAGQGAESLVGLTLGTGVGGVIAIGGRVHSATTARPVRWATRRSTRTDRFAAAGTAAASRHLPAPIGSPPLAERQRSRRP